LEKKPRDTRRRWREREREGERGSCGRDLGSKFEDWVNRFSVQVSNGIRFSPLFLFCKKESIRMIAQVWINIIRTLPPEAIKIA